MAPGLVRTGFENEPSVFGENLQDHLNTLFYISGIEGANGLGFDDAIGTNEIGLGDGINAIGAVGRAVLINVDREGVVILS